MRFSEAFEGWTEDRLTQEQAAEILGICGRTFRRYINRYEEAGRDGLIDKRVNQLTHRRSPVDEVMALSKQYRDAYFGWNVNHFHGRYHSEGGKRSYTWFKEQLQKSGLVHKAKGKGTHRKRRTRPPLPGMMIHQDGSTHQWVAGIYWDLIVTLDDATNEHDSLFFVEAEGTASSFQGRQEMIDAKGLCCTFYSGRGSHYWTTPEGRWQS